MAKATRYDREYGFTGYQSANPTSPLPGNQVDAELDAVAQTAGEIADNLELIQRDDGRLANGSVHPDALDGPAKLLIGSGAFRPQGAWTAGAEYRIGDMVSVDKSAYIAFADHIAGVAFTPLEARSYWLPVAINATPETAAKQPVRAVVTSSAALVGAIVADGVTLAIGDRAARNATTEEEQNGVYVVAAGAWPRARDFDDDEDFVPGTTIRVLEGSIHAGRTLALSAVAPIQVGVTELTWIDADQVVKDIAAALDVRLTTAEATIVSHGTRITTAEGTIVSQGTRLTTAEGTIASQGTRLSTAEGTISNHGGRLTTAEADIVEIRTIAEAGFALRESVRCMTTTNVNLANALEDGDTLVGLTLATGDRVFTQGQTAPAERRVWVVQASGAAVAADDLDSEAELLNARFLVREGNVNPGTTWQLTTEAPITPGTTGLTWRQLTTQSVIDAELAVARGGYDELVDRLDASDDRLDAFDGALSYEAATGRTATPVSGTNVTARTIVMNDPAFLRRTYTQLRIYNASGVSREIKLRRMEDVGTSFDEVSGNVDVTVTVPSSGPAQTVDLLTPFILEIGEYPGIVSENNAYTSIVAASDHGGYYSGGGDLTTVPKTGLVTGVQYQIGIDFTEPAVTGVDYRERAATLSQHDLDLTKVLSDLYEDIVVGNSGIYGEGTSLQAGSWVWKDVAPERRRFTKLITRNNTASARAIVLQHSIPVGSNYVKVAGSTDLAITVPAGPGDKEIDIDFVQEAGESIRFASLVPGWTTYVNDVGDEGGMYYLNSVADTVPTTTLFDTIRPMLRLEGQRAAFEGEAPVDGGDGDGALAEVVVSVDTSDRIMFTGDSYTASGYALLGKSWLEKFSAESDWPVENYGVNGSTVAGRTSAIRSNTIVYGNLGPRDYDATDIVVGVGRNDSAGITTTAFEERMRQFHETARGLGARVHVIAEHADAWGSDGDEVNTGFGDSMLIKSVAEQLGAGFINVMERGRLLGRGAGYERFWNGSHPGTRTNGIWQQKVREYFYSLDRPRQAVKLFRPRPGVSVSSVADLFFQTNFERQELWKEVQVGVRTLADQAYYDKLDAFPLSTEVIDSEYLSFMAGNALSFTNYALVYLVLRHEAKHIAECVFEMNDIGADIYIPNNILGATSDDTPVGAWTRIVGAAGRYPIGTPALRIGMRHDVLPILIVKSGAFSLTKVCQLVYQSTGPEKARVIDRPIPPRPRGAELLSNPTFPTSGAPDGWSVTGSNECQTTADAVDGNSHRPYGVGGVFPVGVDESITATVTYDENPLEDVEAQIRVICRRFPDIFPHTDTFPDEAPITNDSFDLTKLRVSLTIGDIIAEQWAPVDVCWDEVVFSVVLPAGTTGLDVTVTADSDVQVGKISFRPVEA